MPDIETIRAYRTAGSERDHEHGHGHSRRHRFLTGFALGVLASVVLAGSGALIVGAFTAASSGGAAECVQPAPTGEAGRSSQQPPETSSALPGRAAGTPAAARPSEATPQGSATPPSATPPLPSTPPPTPSSAPPATAAPTPARQ